MLYAFAQCHHPRFKEAQDLRGIKMFLILSVLVACATAAQVPFCHVTDWTAWGDCQASKLCPVPDVDSLIRSYPLPVVTIEDEGRVHMKIMMEEKLRQAAERASCIKAGACSQSIPSFGETECDEGSGLAGIYPCRNVDILSFVNIEDLGYNPPHPDDPLPEGNDIWGWTDPLNNDEYAIVGLTGGTSFVRITDPRNPVTLAFIPSRTGPSTWRDIKVIQNTAYIVSEALDHGLQVFDLERLRQWTEFQQGVEPDVLYSEFGNAHNIVSNVETKFLYVVGATQTSFPRSCRGGLHVINVADRLNPVYAGCFDEDGYVHDAECVIYHGPDQRYMDREICFCYNENTFTIVDVNDKAQMKMIAREGYTGSMYTHQGWITEDHTIVLLDDELDEFLQPNTKTYIWDVTDMENPDLKRTYRSTQTAIDHNQYIKDGFTYQANYEAGLRILYVDQNSFDLNEVGYLDVHPDNTRAQFNGAWSVYPYFPSGTVVVSSINYGLFVLQPDYEALKRDAGVTYAEKSRSRGIVKTNTMCPQMEEFQKCQAPAC